MRQRCEALAAENDLLKELRAALRSARGRERAAEGAASSADAGTSPAGTSPVWRRHAQHRRRLDPQAGCRALPRGPRHRLRAQPTDPPPASRTTSPSRRTTTTLRAASLAKAWASCRRPPGPRRAFRRTGATRGSGSSARSGWRRSRRTRCSSITSLYQERSGLGGVRLPPSTHAGLAGLAKMGNGETPLTSAAAGTHLEVVRALFCKPARQSTRRTTAVDLWLQGFYIGLLETQRGHGQP